ncbi:MAG: Ribonuclease VapC [Microgenomates group bacterium Gr01-1014_16]|nr:MAG: Ribonuclease VapC [Microgenomates group bacterium Gr01-1014_16]
MRMSSQVLIGVDANWLVYYLNKNSVFHKRVKKAFEELEKKDVQLVATWQTFAEFFAIVSDKKRFEHCLKPGQVAGLIKNYIDSDWLQLVFPNIYTGRVFLKLIEETKPVGQRIHDIFLAATLISNGVETLLTENVKDFAGTAGLKVMDLEGTLL